MAGSPRTESTIPKGRDPLANSSFSQPPVNNLITNTMEEVKPEGGSKPETASEGGKKPEQKPEAKQKPESDEDEDKGKGKGKDKVTVLVSTDLLERLRNAAWWQRKTLATLAEEGIQHVVEKLERKNGGPFEPRQEELKTGRPQKIGTAKSR